MRIVTHHYGANTGWAPELPPPGAAAAPEGGATVLMVFGASAFLDDPAPLRALRAAYPDAVATGCSSAGEILGDDIHDGGLVAAVLTFEQTRVRRVARGIAELGDARALGRALAEPLIGDDLQGIFVLSDGLAINGTQLMTGLQGLLPGVIITGGLAGDDDRFQRTWVLNEAGEPESGTACALGFYGPRVHRVRLQRRLAHLRARAPHHPRGGQRGLRAGR
ncbi:MAG: hypothetical protein KC933_05820 [Myxococcales bacterium]|nr:hypothetical protein [Myxococcales bacterium]